jgi:hypothetical protein
MRGPKPSPNDHPVYFAGAERVGRAFNAERADEPHLFAERDRQDRVGATAIGDEHGRFRQRIARGQFRRLRAAPGERGGAAQHRAVQRADPQSRAEPARDPLGGCACRHHQRVGDRHQATVAQIGDHWSIGTRSILQLGRECACLGFVAIAARFGEHHG